MISDTRGLWHSDMIRSPAARSRVSKCATGDLGVVLTKWRLASTDAGRNEALGLHELERRRLQAGTLSEFVEYLALERPQCKQFKKNQKMGSSRNQEKNGPVKVKKHKLESHH